MLTISHRISPVGRSLPGPGHLFQGGDGIFLLIRRPAAKRSHSLTPRVWIHLQKLESLQLSYLLQHPHRCVMCAEGPGPKTAEK